MNEKELAAKLEALSTEIDTRVQELADIAEQHVELVLGFPWAAYYKRYHPASCPERQAKQLPAHDDVPDVFKAMFNNDTLPDEPRPE